MSLEEPATALRDQVSLEASSPSVVVVDSDPRMRTRLAVQLGESVRAELCTTLDEIDDNRGGGRRVIIAGPSLANEAGVATLSAYLNAHAQTQAIIATDELTTSLLQLALRAGISDVLSVPFETAQIQEALDRAVQRIPTMEIGPAISPNVMGPEVKGKVITVFSTKGGAGKSVIATNLAVALAQRSKRPVVLLDCDLQFGDVAVMLKLTPQQTVADVVNVIDRIDVQSLEAMLARHDRSGLYVLPAPTEPAFADQITAVMMNRIVDILKDFAEYIVIDTPANFSEVVIGVIEKSDEIVLVAGMDIPNIKNVKIGLQVLRLLEIPTSRLKLVLNRANAKVKLDIREVERTLQLKADCLVPSDIVIPHSVNKGVPAILEEPRSAVAKSIEGLAELVMTDVQAQKQKGQG